MSNSFPKRQEDFLWEVNPCPSFPAQRIKLWYDDFSGEFYPVQRHNYKKHIKKASACIT